MRILAACASLGMLLAFTCCGEDQSQQQQREAAPAVVESPDVPTDKVSNTPPDPLYGGKPASYWFKQLSDRSQVTRQTAANALFEIGRTEPHILDKLSSIVIAYDPQNADPYEASVVARKWFKLDKSDALSLGVMLNICRNRDGQLREVILNDLARLNYVETMAVYEGKFFGQFEVEDRRVLLAMLFSQTADPPHWFARAFTVKDVIIQGPDALRDYAEEVARSLRFARTSYLNTFGGMFQYHAEREADQNISERLTRVARMLIPDEKRLEEQTKEYAQRQRGLSSVVGD